MRKRSLIPVMIVVALCLLLVSGAWAHQQTPAEERQEKRQEIQDERSEIIHQRIELIITRFNNNKDRHIETYRRVKEKLKEIGDALDAQGYDTSKVREDYRNLDAKIVKAAKDYATFINKLEETLDYVPGASNGQFAATLAEARSLLRTFREDILDIRHFYQTVVRPDVQALKEQTPSE